MIGHYLSSNNEMCYSTKAQTFSRTKHSPVLSFFLRRIKIFDFSGKKHSKFRLEPFLLCSPSLRLQKPQIHLSNDFPYRINAWKKGSTSYIRMTFGCLMSFMVEISRFICNCKHHGHQNQKPGLEVRGQI